MVDHLKKAKDWLDSVDKGRVLVESLQHQSLERMTCLFEFYPEVAEFKHETIACLLGLSRESVSRSMNLLGIYRRKPCAG